MAIKTLTYNRLCELFSYNPNTGKFTRLKNHGNSKAGDVLTGSLQKNGYLVLSIDNKKYFCHQLAWLYETGDFSLLDIDHKNRDRTDNRISNLRESSRQENLFNSTIRSDNTSGIKGITWDKKSEKWRAKIQISGKTIHVGRFMDIEDAIVSLNEKRLELHGTFQCRG